MPCWFGSPQCPTRERPCAIGIGGKLLREVRTARSGAKLAARNSATDMRILYSLVTLMIPFVTAIHAAAQSPPPRPYTPVAITRPAPSEDASFIAFRAALAAAAKTRIYAELAALVLPQGFFWDRDFGQPFDARQPGGGQSCARDRSRTPRRHRLGCARGVRREAAAEPLELASRRDLRAGAAGLRRRRIREASGHHLHRRASIGPIRARTDARSASQRSRTRPLVGTLGPHFVRLLGFEGADSEPPRAPGGRTSSCRTARPATSRPAAWCR